MKFNVRYRLDNEEYFTTDTDTIQVDSWEKALEYGVQKENHYNVTLLSIECLDNL